MSQNLLVPNTPPASKIPSPRFYPRTRTGSSISTPPPQDLKSARSVSPSPGRELRRPSIQYNVPLPDNVPLPTPEGEIQSKEKLVSGVVSPLEVKPDSRCVEEKENKENEEPVQFLNRESYQKGIDIWGNLFDLKERGVIAALKKQGRDQKDGIFDDIATIIESLSDIRTYPIDKWTSSTVTSKKKAFRQKLLRQLFKQLEELSKIVDFSKLTINNSDPLLNELTNIEVSTEALEYLYDLLFAIFLRQNASDEDFKERRFAFLASSMDGKELVVFYNPELGYGKEFSRVQKCLIPLNCTDPDRRDPLTPEMLELETALIDVEVTPFTVNTSQIVSQVEALDRVKSLGEFRKSVGTLNLYLAELDRPQLNLDLSKDELIPLLQQLYVKSVKTEFLNPRIKAVKKQKAEFKVEQLNVQPVIDHLKSLEMKLKTEDYNYNQAKDFIKLHLEDGIKALYEENETNEAERCTKRIQNDSGRKEFDKQLKSMLCQKKDSIIRLKNNLEESFKFLSVGKKKNNPTKIRLAQSSYDHDIESLRKYGIRIKNDDHTEAKEIIDNEIMKINKYSKDLIAASDALNVIHENGYHDTIQAYINVLTTLKAMMVPTEKTKAQTFINELEQDLKVIASGLARRDAIQKIYKIMFNFIKHEDGHSASQEWITLASTIQSLDRSVNPDIIGKLQDALDKNPVFSGNSEQNRLDRKQAKGLKQLIHALKEGSDFETLYQTLREADIEDTRSYEGLTDKVVQDELFKLFLKYKELHIENKKTEIKLSQLQEELDSLQTQKDTVVLLEKLLKE